MSGSVELYEIFCGLEPPKLLQKDGNQVSYTHTKCTTRRVQPHEEKRRNMNMRVAVGNYWFVYSTVLQ